VKYSKILEIGPIPPPRAGWGVRIDYVLSELRTKGIQCAALDLGINRANRTPGEDGIEGATSGLDYAVKVLKYLLRGYRIHNHLNGESWKAYILVLYSTLMSWLFFRPPILTWHGGLGYRWFPETNNAIVKAIHWTIFHLHTHTICNDDIIKKHILAYGLAESRVVPIPAFSRQYLDYRTAQLPQEVTSFLAQRSPTIFCYVYYRPEFYLSELVEAMKLVRSEFPDFGILLVGCTKGSDRCRQQMNQADLTDNVLYVDDLDHDQFLTLLSQVKLCLRTHKRDGISSSVLEALSLGIPVVAADNPLRPEQVFTYRADDPQAMADATIKVLRLSADELPVEKPEIDDTVADEIALLVRSNVEIAIQDS
jgi:glycosyltransferase involved in cell wall biosynthesis